ncbi:MAG: class I SAM-dependent methyltransferase [Planctomycetales bacterium]|nr:class I SAM-dependent methyltransferase [Planctomycetales bacterium]
MTVATKLIVPPVLITGQHCPAAICAVCGGSVWKPVFGESLSPLMACDACKIQRVYPTPSEAELSNVYNSDYYERFGSAYSASEYRKMKAANAEIFFNRIERIAPVGTFLDVGCGLGENLIVGSSRGWIPHAVDRNECSVAACEMLAPERVKLLDWERDYWRGRDLDLVMFCDVIEHFYRPDEALRKANNCLRENGLVFLTTPNIESLWARLLGHRWWHYHIDHLWYFSCKTLCRLAENAGFEVLECGPTKKRFALRYIVSILANSEKHVTGRRLSRQLLRFLPDWVLAWQLPPVTEGLTLIGRKVGT